MEIASNQPFIGPDSAALSGATTSEKPASGQSFASFLETQSDAAMNAAVLAGNQGGEAQDSAEDDIAFIRKNGFQAYLERNHERKLEEMREQILIGMGLNEEMLAAMPAEQRGLIEKMIAEEIQARLAAEAEFNRGSEQSKNAAAGQGENALTPAPAPTVFLDSPGRMQAMVGFSIVDAVANPDNLAGKDDDRQILPTDD
ncbi:MAG: hypothetical protein ACI9JL_000568 [Paracoccaceae bacterium]|jgi:hypothetical protein